MTYLQRHSRVSAVISVKHALEEICAYVNQGVGGCRVSEKKKKVQVSYEERGVFEHAHVERPNRTAGRERRLNSGRDTGTNEKITTLTPILILT